MMEPHLFLSYKKATILKVKHKKRILSFPDLFSFRHCRVFILSCHVRPWAGHPRTQGTGSRYARRKQRASTKFRAAADVAVKLATACHSRAFILSCYSRVLFFPSVIPVFFSSPLSFPYFFLLLCHSRAWHGNLKEMSVSSPDMTICCQLDRNTSCGTNLCRNALLSACISWASALCLLMSVCKFPTALGPFRPVGLELRL